MIFIDVETYSPEPIKNGHFRYAEKADLLLVAWAVDDGPIEVWDVTKDLFPKALTDLLFKSKDIMVAHNAAFEQAIFHSIWGNPGLIDPKRWRCTMAQAYAHGLPGSLDALGAVLGLKQVDQKYKTGHDLIRLFCIPPAKNSKRTERATKLTHPEQWEKFKDYCRQDIIATREIYKKLPKWNYQGFELDLWHLDQKINQRGINIDLDLANAAIKAIGKTQSQLKQRTVEITAGAVGSTTQRDILLKHILETYGVKLPDMQASTLERRIEDPDLPEGLKELLRIRIQATTSSTAKYSKILKSVSSDGRLRGTLQWCGAGRTGRDAGRILNPQNLPRATMEPEDINMGIEAFKFDCADVLFDNVMELASNTIRGVITASNGNKLLIADLKNIEGRYAAWLAGEEWKLQAFRDFDLGIGADLYKLAYAKSFHIKPEDVNKIQRQVGKTMELALGFGGGVGSFVTFALGFGIDLHTLVEEGYDTIPEGIKKEAENYWDYCVREGGTLGLEKDVFITCDSLKRMWRNAHPEIVSMWRELEQAMRNAICSPGELFIVRKLKVQRDGNWLRVLMPSGRCLCYPHPQMSDKGEISFMGLDQYTRKWGRIKTYGAKQFENDVQGGARDVFMYGAVGCDLGGYDIVMRIHDELITEVPDDKEFTVEKLCELMTTNISWCEGLPLAASGFETYRYRKAD